MQLKKLITLLPFFVFTRAFSQWEVSGGGGVAVPITGYGKVVRSGYAFNLDGRYRLKPHLATGMRLQVARFARDKNPTDQFHGAKLTVVPVVFNLEYSFGAGKLKPYLSGGVGISFFVLSDNSSATAIDDKEIFNVSFTMAPLAGIRYSPHHHLYACLESGFAILADGPPVGFPMGEKVTGHHFIAVGVGYKF